VVANETVVGRALREAVEDAAEGYRTAVLVVSPALNSPLRHWTSDEDQARVAADERLRRSVAELERIGIDARGEVGDADPVQAIEDALRTFGADVIVISTHPEGRSNWLERGVVTSARERFAVPIKHVVVDLEAEAAGV
jgi:nucleotide-binding universal stress UspA family protein